MVFGFWFLVFAPAKADNTTCSVFDAIYKPNTLSKKHKEARLDISEMQDSVARYTAHATIFISSTQYNLEMEYICGGGAYPSCYLHAQTTEGKPLSVPVEALDHNLMSTVFLSEEMAPKLIIFPNIGSSMYYKSKYLNIKMTHPKKPQTQNTISEFPSVWIFETCKRKTKKQGKSNDNY